VGSRGRRVVRLLLGVYVLPVLLGELLASLMRPLGVPLPDLLGPVPATLWQLVAAASLFAFVLGVVHDAAVRSRWRRAHDAPRVEAVRAGPRGVSA
jgi:nitrate/nitrite transporter NarK